MCGFSRKAGATTALMALAIFVSSGCGPDVSRTDLRGSATFAGQPIVFGTVKFVPDADKDHSGPQGTADIVDGKYDTSLEGGAGIVPGPHKISVTAYEERPLASDDETLPSLAKPPLFLNYVIEADLQGGTYDITVPEEARGFGVGASNAPVRPSNEP